MTDVIFSVIDRWGDEIALTKEDWARLTSKRPDIEPYLDEVQTTLERPNIVYEGRYRDTKVFYAKDLLGSPFGGCYVAVAVRYSTHPASIRTVYFPFHVQAALGRLLHAEH